MLELYPHQTLFSQSVEGSLLLGHGCVLACASTGFGKTVVATSWIKDFIDSGKRVMALMDRKLLVLQLGEMLKRNGILVSYCMADEPQDPNAKVTVGTFQTYKKRHIDRVSGELPKADILIIDEFHRAMNSQAQVFRLYPDASVIGLTATPFDSDGMLIPSDSIVNTHPNSWLVKNGWLLPVDVFAPLEPYVDDISPSGNSDYSEAKIGNRMRKLVFQQDMMRAWEPHQDKQTIVFAPTRKYAAEIAEQFTGLGFPADYIDCATKSKDRKEIIEKFKDRELRVLVNRSVLTTGFDAPIAQCMIDLAPTLKFREYWQKVGRIKRPYEGQKRAVLLDLAGNALRYTHPNDDWDFPEPGQTVEAKFESSDKSKADVGMHRCNECGCVWSGGSVVCPYCAKETTRSLVIKKFGDGQLRAYSLAELQKLERERREKREKLDPMISAYIGAVRCLLRMKNKDGSPKNYSCAGLKFQFKRLTGKNVEEVAKKVSLPHYSISPNISAREQWGHIFGIGVR